MAERITLEVPATLSALSTVRLVLGGLATRLDFPYEHLDDLSLATDNLLRAALDSEDLEDLRIAFHADGGTLRVACGLFRSASLRERVGVTPGNCIDLCLVLRRLVDEVAVQGEPNGYSIMIVKHRAGPQP